MKKLDRLVKAAMVQADTKAQISVKEILAAVDGLWLLKEGE